MGRLVCIAARISSITGAGACAGAGGLAIRVSIAARISSNTGACTGAGAGAGRDGTPSILFRYSLYLAGVIVLDISIF